MVGEELDIATDTRETSDGADRPVAEQAEQMAEAVVDAADDVTEAVADSTASWLRQQSWVLTVTKVGWAAKAVVYAVIGWAALFIALRRPGRPDAEYTGIAVIMADRWWTRLLLVVVAAGLVSYVAYRVLSVLLIDTNDLDAWAHRVAYSVSAATYVTVGWTSFDAAITGAHHDDGSSVERFSADLLGTTLGRLLMGLGALGAIGVAAYFAYKGATRRFLRELDLTGAAPWLRRLLEWGGAVGWIGRGVVVAAVAVFLLGAAVQADPFEARGLDRALQRVAVGSTLGSVVVFGTGALLILYAVYCGLSAPVRRLAWSSRHDPDPKESSR